MRISENKRAPIGRAATLLRDESVTGEPLDRMFGHETVTTGVAGPEIADQFVVQIGRRFRGDHGVGAYRAGR